jgi:hypothetical protein
MPKAKLKIANADFKKLAVAAEFSGVKLLKEESRVVGDDAYIMCSTPSSSNYFELGKLFKTVAGTELDNQPEPVKKGKPTSAKA